MQLAVFNIMFDLLLIGAYYAIGLLMINEIMAFAGFVLCFAVFMIPVFAVNEAAAKTAGFKSVSFKETLSFIPLVWKDALLFGALVAAVILLAVVGIPFYMATGGLVGVFLAAVVFWASAIAALSLQWFPAIKAQLKDPFLKALKKSFIVFFDNPGFSIFMFFYSLLLCVISAFLAFLAPGITGLLFSHNNAFRLRMYKYEWLEQHPEIPPKQARRQIPWDELIAEDRETLGPRSLKSFIFPWKD